jgi:peptide deformylase
MHLEIVDIDDSSKSKILTTPMDAVNFPLTAEDKQFIEALKSKVIELEAAGLAAPQVGVAKPITAFEVSQAALKWREDITHLVPLTVLINPSYEPIESQGRSLDWEGCFSGKNHYGKVWRYKAIRYRAQDIDGKEIQGEAVGFLARLLQHEIDHCHNKMCVHSYDANSPHGTQADLMPTRKDEARQKKQKLGLGPDDSFPFLHIN